MLEISPDRRTTKAIALLLASQIRELAEVARRSGPEFFHVADLLDQAGATAEAFRAPQLPDQPIAGRPPVVLP